MADLTFKGTTQQVLLEIGKGALSKIDANTKVTITDNEYTLGNLTTITTTVTANKIKLEKTSAAVDFADTFINLNAVLPKVEKYTGAVTITDNVAFADVANLNKIAGLTTGKVTATLLAGAVDSDLVTALENVNSKDNIYFKATNAPLADNSDVRALISLSKLLPKADFSAINSIISSDVSLVKQALVILKNNAAVAVNLSAIEVTAADANDIAKATKGGLTATIKDGKVAETLKALSDVNASDNISFTTTDRTVKASDLFNLGAKFKTITNFDASSVTTVTGEAKDVATLTAALTTATAAGATIADTTVAGQITLTELAAIKAAGSGDLTATVVADAASILNTKLTAAGTGATDILTLTVNGTTAAAADLAGLVTLTGGKIKLEATTVSGLLADVQSVYITNKAQFTALGNENVTIITNTPSATQLNAIAAATTGKVTATLDPTAALTQATVTALKDVKTSDNITFAPTGGPLTGKDSINALLAIKKILPNANFVAVKNITGVDAKDAAIVKNVLKLIDPTSDVTFATGELSAKDANDIAKVITTGKLTATLKDGSVAATLKALTDVDGALDVLKFKTTDKTAKASDLVDLDTTLGTGNFDLTNVTTITGTAAEAGATGAIIDALTLTTAALTNPEVKITGTVAVADIKAIIDATSGKVTATLAAGTANDLATALADTNLPTGGNAINVVVNDTSVGNAKDLADIAAATSGKIKVESLEVIGSLANVSNVYITNKGKFTGLGNEDIDISTTADAAAVSVDALAKVTSGILTADVADDKANNLVSQLKNANAKDALTITVSNDPSGTSAKDLLTLDGKTSVPVNAGAVTAISGSVAEINKLAGADVNLSGFEAYTISGTVKAADLNAIADTTTGVITATVAADTAEKLAYTLDSTKLIANALTNQINLKVTGATAAAVDLNALNGITAVNVQVDAKEVTGTIAQLGTAGTGLYALTTGFTGLGNKNVKIDNALTASTAADVTAVSTILAGTIGVVTATANGTVAQLLTIANATSGKDALTLNIITDTTATATDLLALDAKTSVKVDATALSVSGSAAQLKELAAAKGVQLAKDVALTVTGATNAADLAAVLKATTGKVTAAVAADTASALNKALKDANSSDALTLTVNDTIVAAKDLISLNGKTSVPIVVNVGAITGNIAEITDVFVTNVAQFTGVTTDDATISGTANAIDVAKITVATTTGVVTATVAADTAESLLADLTTVVGGSDKLTLKVNGTTAVATDLTGLDAKTVIAVDASAIKNLTYKTAANGATEVDAAITAAKNGGISGLGNKTVDLVGALDADTALVKAINDFTTGVVTLDVLTFDKAAAAGATFNLNQLGDLKGITGLEKIDADNGQNDTIAIKLDDLLAANDSKTSFSFDIAGDNGGTDAVTFDATGWTVTTTTPNIKYEFTKGSQTITVDLTDISSATVL